MAKRELISDFWSTKRQGMFCNLNCHVSPTHHAETKNQTGTVYFVEGQKSRIYWPYPKLPFPVPWLFYKELVSNTAKQHCKFRSSVSAPKCQISPWGPWSWSTHCGAISATAGTELTPLKAVTAHSGSHLALWCQNRTSEFTVNNCFPLFINIFPLILDRLDSQLNIKGSNQLKVSKCPGWCKEVESLLHTLNSSVQTSL